MTKFEMVETIIRRREADNTINADNWWSRELGRIVSKGEYIAALRDSLMDEDLQVLKCFMIY